MNKPITLGRLIANLSDHLRNPDGKDKPVYVYVKGETTPITLGGVSTEGNCVVLYCSSKES